MLPSDAPEKKNWLNTFHAFYFSKSDWKESHISNIICFEETVKQQSGAHAVFVRRYWIHGFMLLFVVNTKIWCLLAQEKSMTMGAWSNFGGRQHSQATTVLKDAFHFVQLFALFFANIAFAIHIHWFHTVVFIEVINGFTSQMASHSPYMQVLYCNDRSLSSEDGNE